MIIKYIKRLLLSAILLAIIGCFAYGQKQDYVWLSGYDSYAGYDSNWGFYFGTSVLNFNDTLLNVYYDTLQMNFDFTNTSYCDSNGNLLFYTNGIYIANNLDETIENGNSINAGYYTEVWDPTVQQTGYANPQGILALQNVSNPNQYYLIYSYDSAPLSGDLFCSNILMALLDMSANGGHGKVLFKNQSLIQDNFGTELTATRHANGKDWWILIQKRNSNCFYRVLVDSTGPHLLPDSSCLGTVMNYGQIGAACFSPDGSKYVYLGSSTGVNVYDFDRCNGIISNPKYLSLPVIADSGWSGIGVAISPNNRYLYVSLTKQLYQFDLTNPDFFESIDTVGFYDGFKSPIGSYFNTAQIGPDGKIYISCGNGETDYHVINNPDARGDSCQFMQHAIHLPSPSLGVPNFPNYRLGPGCDSTFLGVNSVSVKEQIVKAFPNPASNYVIIDYGFTDWSKGGVYLKISNALGQMVYEQALPMYSGFQKIDVSNYAAGFYIANIERQGGFVGAAKFAKQ